MVYPCNGTLSPENEAIEYANAYASAYANMHMQMNMQKGLQRTEWGGKQLPTAMRMASTCRAGHWELHPECSSHRPEAAGLEAIPPSYCLSPHFLASIKEEIRVVRKPLCISLSGSDFSCKGVS